MTIQVSRDAEGYLINPDDWNEEIAIKLAQEESIELNDEYWPAITFIRDHFNEHGTAPDVRHVVTHIAMEQSCHKKEAKKLVFKLFPYGYVKQACKIAGMKRPRAWSTG